MAERSYRRLFWAFAITGTVLDQVSKYGVFRWLYNDGEGGRFEIAPGWFRLLAVFSDEKDAGGLFAPLRTWSGEKLPATNNGALFGFRPTEWLDWLFSSTLSTTQPWVDNLVFAVISLVAAAAIIAWTFRPSTARDRTLCIALGLILAGTVGNLYDRVVFSGVRDFLHFYWFRWPVFNVADSCLVCGAALLLLQAFFMKPAPAEQSAPGAAQASPQMAEAK
jgi:lipoprotein signal peptidase